MNLSKILTTAIDFFEGHEGIELWEVWTERVQLTHAAPNHRITMIMKLPFKPDYSIDSLIDNFKKDGVGHRRIHRWAVEPNVRKASHHDLMTIEFSVLA